MSDPIELEIPARERKLTADVSIRRLLPYGRKRAVGPWVFFDHMGPLELPAGVSGDVLPHPHIGLATVTYLFEGELVHRDSLGTHCVIRPGAVNWMTAGHGIVHSERDPQPHRQHPRRLHGLQLWVALPRHLEEMEPTFEHVAAEDIPQIERPGARIRVLAGTLFGQTSPVRTASRLFYAELRIPSGAVLELPPEYEERCLYVVEGSLTCAGRTFAGGAMVVIRPGEVASLRAETDVLVMALGGDPLDGPRHMDWNFVSSSEARIEQAKTDWRAHRFPLIPGDENDYVPLPE